MPSAAWGRLNKRSRIVHAPQMVRVLWWSLLACVLVWALAIDVLVARDVLGSFGHHQFDFLTFWSAARAPHSVVYDIPAITQAQHAVIPVGKSPRPFPYPPSFLFELWPFGRLPLAAALITWLVLGVSLYGLAAWRLVGRLWPLALASPAVAVSAATGQVSFLMAAAVMMGVIWLPARPILAGVTLGLAATVKPQVLVMVPLALFVGRHWRAMGSATAMGALIGAASLFVHREMWLDWLRSLGEFSRIIREAHWDEKISTTPAGMLEAAGLLTPLLGTATLILGAIAAIALVVWAFRRNEPVERYAALCIGYLLVSPYALWYELVLLQPVAIRLVFGRKWAPRAAGLLTFVFFPKALAVIAMAAAVPAWPKLRVPRSGRAALETQD